MLIAQGTTQLTTGDTPMITNSRSPVIVDTTLTSGPNELTALTSTTAALVATSHADNDNCDSFQDLESALADDAEQETNV